MFTERCVFYLLITLILIGTQHFCQHIDEVKRLIKDKEKNYDKELRPVINQSESIAVYLNFSLLSIQEVNEVKQTVTLNAYISIRWRDEKIAWEPADYDGIVEFAVNSGRFWTPPLLIINTNDKLDFIGNPSIKTRYANTGVAFYDPGLSLTVSCRLDIRFYPWDRHRCFLQFDPWHYVPEELILINQTSHVDTTFYKPNGQWDLISSGVSSIAFPHKSTSYQVVIFIERQSTYVIVNVILPVIVLSLLNLMIFFIPNVSGERISFSITLLLAVTVFMTIVADNLPKSSTPMALFSYYLLIVLVMSNCITLSVIYSLCLYHRDESEPVGSYWQCIVRVMKYQCRSKKRNSRKYQNEVPSNKSGFGHNKDDKCSTIQVDPRMVIPPFYSGNYLYVNGKKRRKVSSKRWPPRNAFSQQHSSSGENEKNECSNVKEHENSVEKHICWKDVSVAFDRICFMIFMLLLIIASVASLAYIYFGRLKDNEK
ncbi:Neuronal acetylcholine receptor subunit beta-4 [Mactra antiquata]